MFAVDEKYFADLCVNASKSNSKTLGESLWLEPQFIPCEPFYHQGNWHGQVVCWPQPPRSEGEKREKNHHFWSPLFSFPNVLQEMITYLSPFLTKYGLSLPCCSLCTWGCDLGKKGIFPLNGGGGCLLTCLSSPGGLWRAIELCVGFFSPSFPIFVQIKTIQK